MNSDTVWVLIPLFALSIPIFRIWTRHLQKVAEINARTTAEKARNTPPTTVNWKSASACWNAS